MVLNGIRVGNGKVPFNDIDMVYQTNENFSIKLVFHKPSNSLWSDIYSTQQKMTCLITMNTSYNSQYHITNPNDSSGLECVVRLQYNVFMEYLTYKLFPAESQIICLNCYSSIKTRFIFFGIMVSIQ